MRSQRYCLLAFSMAVLHCGPLWAQTTDYWLAELERGYQADSQEPLVALLDAWHADSKPVAADMVQKKLPFERDIYDIYSAFFEPDERYDDTKYVIIQDEIEVVVVDSDLSEAFSDGPLHRYLDRIHELVAVSTVVIKDFRPNMRLESKKVLYRQGRYLAPLVGFVTQDKDPLDLLRGNRYQWEENLSDERQERLQYLNTTLRIIPGHWAKGWHFETHPFVNLIYLSSTRERAVVFFRVRYKFGVALLEKVEDRVWKALPMKIYAIE